MGTLFDFMMDRKTKLGRIEDGRGGEGVYLDHNNMVESVE